MKVKAVVDPNISADLFRYAVSESEMTERLQLIETCATIVMTVGLICYTIYKVQTTKKQK